MGKLINRIPGLHLLISSLPCSALRTYVESLGKPQVFSMSCDGCVALSLSAMGLSAVCFV